MSINLARFLWLVIAWICLNLASWNPYIFWPACQVTTTSRGGTFSWMWRTWTIRRCWEVNCPTKYPKVILHAYNRLVRLSSRLSSRSRVWKHERFCDVYVCAYIWVFACVLSICALIPLQAILLCSHRFWLWAIVSREYWWLRRYFVVSIELVCFLHLGALRESQSSDVTTNSRPVPQSWDLADTSTVSVPGYPSPGSSGRPTDRHVLRTSTTDRRSGSRQLFGWPADAWRSNEVRHVWEKFFGLTDRSQEYARIKVHEMVFWARCFSLWRLSLDHHVGLQELQANNRKSQRANVGRLATPKFISGLILIVKSKEHAFHWLRPLVGHSKL